LKLGAYAFIQMPASIDELVTTVQRALDQRRT
jgi:DNA-binding NtrC family response regulator